MELPVAAPTTTPNRTLVSASRFQQARPKENSQTPNIFSEKMAAATISTPQDLHVHLTRPESQRGTVLYLAYGSNLSNETFRGNRGIKPLSQINVQVPSLRLTFDLPGLPYAEPCFANTGRRDPANDPPRKKTSTSKEESESPSQHDGREKYRKNRWHKGLIGVVYEVTPEDYAHIIATEGGGASYQDIMVECHPFDSSDPAASVPQNPSTPSFKAHTLFAPAMEPGEEPPKDGGRFQRPDTSYAQASARYLKLLTDGAAESGLPYEYQDYLKSLHAFTVTTQKQRMGLFVFSTIWMPFIVLVFALGRVFADEKGMLPPWLKWLTAAIFKSVWVSYDGFFKPLFGDGERSIPDGGDDAGAGARQGRIRVEEDARQPLLDVEQAASIAR
jgi:hypothetical protein